MRRAYVGDTVASIVRQLRGDIDMQANNLPANKPRVPSRVFLFTGYTLFSQVVSYAAPCQALQEVIMAPDCVDVVGTVNPADVAGRGTLHVSPYWLDAVTHLAGFVVNCGRWYPQDTACLAVGCDSWLS